jgi:hypothetical protein
MCRVIPLMANNYNRWRQPPTRPSLLYRVCFTPVIPNNPFSQSRASLGPLYLGDPHIDFSHRTSVAQKRSPPILSQHPTCYNMRQMLGALTALPTFCSVRSGRVQRVWTISIPAANRRGIHLRGIQRKCLNTQRFTKKSPPTSTRFPASFQRQVRHLCWSTTPAAVDQNHHHHRHTPHIHPHPSLPRLNLGRSCAMHKASIEHRYE